MYIQAEGLCIYMGERSAKLSSLTNSRLLELNRDIVRRLTNKSGGRNYHLHNRQMGDSIQSNDAGQST